jgi:glucose-6-phosphate isomerase
MPTNSELWSRYKKYLCECPSLGLSLDISRMNFPHDFFTSMTGKMNAAFAAMDKIDHGAVANTDENRMVGHYWLRDSRRAPTPEIRLQIDETVGSIKTFARDIHAAHIKSPSGKPFTHILVIGIGGSALGPQFVADALTSPSDKMSVHFFDNTDPDGMDRALASLTERNGDAASFSSLDQTLAIVISKSGGTKETRNGMLVAQAAYKAANLDFAKHAVAVTGHDSDLDKTAKKEAWLHRFPMWDWVGGRTSVLSAVGLLPAALQGLDIQSLLDGARDMDEISRLYETMKNPAALLALMWHHAGNGKGAKDMVVLPYKDRLLFFSRYLQQLIMESLGKEKDRLGNIVHQGIAVYGNKGSTDQHAYVQQLREGVNNFFATFIEVLSDRSNVTPESPRTAVRGSEAASLLVEPNVTSGDYLSGFFQGTRTALYANNRESLTLTVDEISPRTIGTLIALYERAVGIYAELVNINAYHQPGVEAGKKAATAVIALQLKILNHLRSGHSGTAEQIALAIGSADDVETVHLILRHLAANSEHALEATPADSITNVIYSA